METTQLTHTAKEKDSTPQEKVPLEFKKVTHSDMPLIWEFLEREKGRTTDFSYGGLFMWVDVFNYEYAVLNDTLFIKGVVENDRSKPAFSLPIGSMNLCESIEILRKYCESEGIAVELSAVPEYALEELKVLQPKSIELLEDWSDYLYDSQMLATLSGKKMSKKRNHVNSFVLHNPNWSYEPLTLNNVGDAVKFMDIYEDELDDAYMGREESRQTRKILNMIGEGDPVMKGGILYNEPRKVCAFTIGDIKGDTLFVHIEKGDRLVPGSYEMINHEFASHIQQAYPFVKYINREDDSGDEGLRRAKESYHPVDLLKKYNVIL